MSWLQNPVFLAEFANGTCNQWWSWLRWLSDCNGLLGKSESNSDLVIEEGIGSMNIETGKNPRAKIAAKTYEYKFLKVSSFFECGKSFGKDDFKMNLRETFLSKGMNESLKPLAKCYLVLECLGRQMKFKTNHVHGGGTEMSTRMQQWRLIPSWEYRIDTQIMHGCHPASGLSIREPPGKRRSSKKLDHKPALDVVGRFWEMIY